MIRPITTFEMSAGLEVQEQIQANTVIHPAQSQTFDVVRDRGIQGSKHTLHEAEESVELGRKCGTPSVLSTDGWIPGMVC